MRLREISASAHPDGNSITLSWINPDPIGHPGIMVVRRQRSYPASPTDGVVVVEGTDLHYGLNADAEALHKVIDENLKGETCYYYSFFPYHGDPPVYVNDGYNRSSAMSTSPYDFAGLMYDYLPRIYHRYDTALPGDGSDEVSQELKQAATLRRFLDLTGKVLDQLYSHARSMLDLHNVDKVDGRLLPLLAEWIGWQSDYRLEYCTQRNDIQNAPYLYKAVGLIPTVEATVKRLTNWESRTKEFVHNIFLTNNPERLNLWSAKKSSDGKWQEAKEPCSLNFAYDGRPSQVVDSDGITWLFYHTVKTGSTNIWCKTYTPEENWSPSSPFTEGDTTQKDPVAVMQKDTLWVFWNSYSENEGVWRILYRTRINSVWSEICIFSDDAKDRRSPAAAVDANGGLWLFFLERDAGLWQMKYNMHDGLSWQLDPHALFPQDAGSDPRVEANTFVAVCGADAAQRLIVFWARKEAAGGQDQTRWAVIYRIKGGIDPENTADWGEVRPRPKVMADANESDPVAFVREDGTFDIFFSSDQSGNWSVRQSSLDVDSGIWGPDEQVTDSPYTDRHPIPVMTGGGLTLIFRSNRAIFYTSQVYKATKTKDLRYSGSVSQVSKDIAKNSLHGKFDDFQAYTCDTGVEGNMTDKNWYSRETIGIYLTPDTEDPGLILRNQRLLRGTLRQFLPIQIRYVFVIEPAVYKEKVYSYDFPMDEDKRFIKEAFNDSLATVCPETYAGLEDSYTDQIPWWRWLKSWDENYTGGGSVDFDNAPVDTSYRTRHVGVEAGGE